MEDQKQQLLTRLKESTNVLVTVSNNPSVDQLAAAIGFTLALGKLNKHATAVYSGDTPAKIDFLEPTKTFEKNTDSLRDFIISLDRSKADKLRYKVEDKVVKIFISPYRTSIKEDDLTFGQGDFNVDLVVALGVKEQGDLDQAITSHGRILHDATVATINTVDNGAVGTIHWIDPQASSLSEMLGDVMTGLKDNLVDNQVATAFLTGIVAETDQFSNEKTKPATMAVSSKLMAAGANQQLVSTELQQAEQAEQQKLAEEQSESLASLAASVPTEEAPPLQDDQSPEQPEPSKDDGVLQIDHDELDAAGKAEAGGGDGSDDEPEEEHLIHIDDKGKLYNGTPPEDTADLGESPSAEDPTGDHPPILQKPQSAMINEPPVGADSTIPGMPTDNVVSTPTDPPNEVNRRNERILSRDSEKPEPSSDSPASPDESQPESDAVAEASEEPAPLSENTPQETSGVAQNGDNSTSTAETTESPISEGLQTLSDIEGAVGAHQEVQSEAELDQARQAIIDAANIETQDQPLPPIDALNAQPVHLDIHPEDNVSDEPSVEPTTHVEEESSSASVTNPNAAPAVPPPMMPAPAPPSTNEDSHDQPTPGS